MTRNSVAYMVMEAFNVGGATGGTGGVVGGTVEVTSGMVVQTLWEARPAVSAQPVVALL